MGLVILAFVMLVTNILTVYFTFNTWYGQRKQKKLIPYTIDENGKYQFDFEEEK